ncbi:uncharacterized protein A4U43_C01F1490, partial [Asparagus officinalis]
MGAEREWDDAEGRSLGGGSGGPAGYEEAVAEGWRTESDEGGCWWWWWWTPLLSAERESVKQSSLATTVKMELKCDSKQSIDLYKVKCK